MNATLIREALRYAAKNNFEHGGAGAAIDTVLNYATDAELVRFAELINSIEQVQPAPAMDSADLARSNID